jgi:hypothetical protein
VVAVLKQHVSQIGTFGSGDAAAALAHAWQDTQEGQLRPTTTALVVGQVQ